MMEPPRIPKQEAPKEVITYILKRFTTELLDALGESTFIQGMITLGVVGVWLFLILTNRPIDETLKYAVGIVTGFYFGTKTQTQLSRLSKKIKGE